MSQTPVFSFVWNILNFWHSLDFFFNFFILGFFVDFLNFLIELIELLQNAKNTFKQKGSFFPKGKTSWPKAKGLQDLEVGRHS